MTCPVCGERTLIYDSRPDESGESVRRRRKCRVCGHRFTTIEQDMWVMKPSDKHELDAYRASGLTPEQVMQLASQANGDMAPIPFADHVVEYDGEWYGITGIPGLLEESE